MSCAWTPPADEAERWSVVPCALAVRAALRRTGFFMNEPSSIAALTRQRLVDVRPAPMFRWPTSELPICPSGSPTSRPKVASCVCGQCGRCGPDWACARARWRWRLDED